MPNLLEFDTSKKKQSDKRRLIVANDSSCIKMILILYRTS